MVKVQAIIDFNYKNYNKIKDLQPANKIQEGKIFAGDIFNVEDDEAKYLTGENKNKIVAVKVLEVIPSIRIIKDKEEAKEIIERARKKINKKKRINNGNSL